MLELKGARQITIVITDDGYTVQEGERYADCLGWDEMLGQIAELTHPELKRDARYRMMDAAGWKAWRERWTKTTPAIEHEDGWDAMIRDAKKRIEDFNYSIQVFERRKAAGDPCPVSENL